ncbi:MAG TPA: hypothetical protein VFV91_02505 [Gaiellaceae bacterium]|nr:hypothetical protein [Gaiellaceae bacterium]
MASSIQDDYAKMRANRPANPFQDAAFVAMAEERQREYEVTTLLDRELDMAEPEVGREIHASALKILADRGLADRYTSAQYVDACKKAGAR